MNAIKLMGLCAGLLISAGCTQRANVDRFERSQHIAAFELDSDELRIEIAHGAEPGTLEAHFIEADTQNAIYLSAVAFEAVAWLGNEAHPLLFRAMQDSKTGERIGRASRFQAHLDRAMTRSAVTLQIGSLPIKGRLVSDVVVSLPAETIDEGSSDVS